MSRLTAAVVLAVVTVAGCGVSPRSPTPATTVITTPPAPTTEVEPRRAAPWPQRPVVDLRYHVAADLATVAGREQVRFTPDMRVCSLVFRTWPNKPQTAQAGSTLAVSAVAVDGRAIRPRVVAAGAPRGMPGTLVEVPLSPCVPAGRSVTAVLHFRLRLGVNVDERVGYSPADNMAWFATGFPLLAWERGRGWAREVAVNVAGEMATSEAFRLASLEVTAPSHYQVLGTGSAADRRPGAQGTTVHRFTAEAVRDVAVSVGRLAVVEGDVDGVRLQVAGPATGTRTPLAAWVEQVANLTRRLTGLLGPYPYPCLLVTIVPDESSGIEFPGAIQVGDLKGSGMSAIVAHEVAHMWLYGLVGNNQGRDPWLDESFATAAAALTTGQEARYSLMDVPVEVAGRTGQPMTFWAAGGSDAYTAGVYDQGAAALLEARRQVGASAFDQALRAYIDANAHQIATPADVAAAFASLPEVVAVLRQVGALSHPRPKGAS